MSYGLNKSELQNSYERVSNLFIVRELLKAAGSKKLFEFDNIGAAYLELKELRTTLNELQSLGYLKIVSMDNGGGGMCNQNNMSAAIFKLKILKGSLRSYYSQLIRSFEPSEVQAERSVQVQELKDWLAKLKKKKLSFNPARLSEDMLSIINPYYALLALEHRNLITLLSIDLPPDEDLPCFHIQINVRRFAATKKVQSVADDSTTSPDPNEFYEGNKKGVPFIEFKKIIVYFDKNDKASSIRVGKATYTSGRKLKRQSVLLLGLLFQAKGVFVPFSTIQEAFYGGREQEELASIYAAKSGLKQIPSVIDFIRTHSSTEQAQGGYSIARET